MGSYSIKDLERLSGIKAHTIRIWEKRYSLVEPKRTSTNIRTYCDAELKQILNVSILNRNGFKISKIAELTSEEIATLVSKLSEDSSDSDSQIENLYLALLDVDENLFDKILSRIIIQYGFEKMVVNILYPFFNRIGIMWQTGTISPAQEHFISNLVRQKLIVAIDSVVPPQHSNAKSFLLFLPETELHELGLLFMHYLLKKRGHKVLYMGAMLPFESLTSLLKLKPVDYLVTSIVSAQENFNIDQYVNQLAGIYHGPIILTGNYAANYSKSISQIVYVPTITDFIKEIETL